MTSQMSSLDRRYLRFELREWSKEAGLFIPMPAKASFGRDICPWCGEELGQMRPGHYAEHVLAKHKESLKPYKGKGKVANEQETA